MIEAVGVESHPMLEALELVRIQRLSRRALPQQVVLETAEIAAQDSRRAIQQLLGLLLEESHVRTGLSKALDRVLES